MKSTQRNIARDVRAYRRRLSDSGEQEVLIRLPNEAVTFIDDLKQRQGLRNRGQALLQLIERGRGVTQQQMT
jgi:hypothetical protein